MDAHTTFVRNWDSLVITQWEDTGNERAVLSAYPESINSPKTGAINKDGDAVLDDSCAMCSFMFEDEDGVKMFRNNGAARINLLKEQDLEPGERPHPILHPFWGAGLSFSRGHFIVRAPYDPHIPMTFTGEEILVCVKGWTMGQ